MDRPSLLALYRGGYLHDIGKVGIPDSILFKPGPLTAEEWVVMRSHPARGEEICRPVKSFAAVLHLYRCRAHGAAAEMIDALLGAIDLC